MVDDAGEERKAPKALVDDVELMWKADAFCKASCGRLLLIRRGHPAIEKFSTV